MSRTGVLLFCPAILVAHALLGCSGPEQLSVSGEPGRRSRSLERQLMQVARSYELQGETDRAQRLYGEIVERNPRLKEAQQRLAKLESRDRAQSLERSARQRALVETLQKQGRTRLARQFHRALEAQESAVADTGVTVEKPATRPIEPVQPPAIASVKRDDTAGKRDDTASRSLVLTPAPLPEAFSGKQQPPEEPDWGELKEESIKRLPLPETEVSSSPTDTGQETINNGSNPPQPQDDPDSVAGLEPIPVPSEATENATQADSTAHGRSIEETPDWSEPPSIAAEKTAPQRPPRRTPADDDSSGFGSQTAEQETVVDSRTGDVPESADRSRSGRSRNTARRDRVLSLFERSERTPADMAAVPQRKNSADSKKQARIHARRNGIGVAKSSEAGDERDAPDSSRKPRFVLQLVSNTQSGKPGRASASPQHIPPPKRRTPYARRPASASQESTGGSAQPEAVMREVDLADLLERLNLEDPRERGLAAYLLGSQGQAAVAALPALRRTFQAETDPEAKINAAEAIVKVDPSDTDALEFLLERLSAEDPHDRWIAAISLGGIPAALSGYDTPAAEDCRLRIVSALMGALRDRSPKVRSMVALILGRVSADQAAGELRKLLRDEDPDVREAADAALACLTLESRED